MIKTVLNDSFSFDDAFAALVPLHKQGVDSAWMHKRAASQIFDFNTISPRKDEVLVHLLALGDGETVGANRNGDYFPKAANVKYHPTFLKAHYFHHHVNDDPKKSYGRVVAAAHNPEMGRVELIVGIDSKKAPADIQAIEKGGSFDVSMSCRVPNDRCSICGNVAKGRGEYCKHASSSMGRILEDGRQVYVINDEPDFFDISRVHRGADRVAKTFRHLQKAASTGFIPGGAELAEMLGYIDSAVPVVKSMFTSQKRGIFAKLAKVVNDPTLQKMASVMQRNALQDEMLTSIKSSGDQTDIWRALQSAGVCLPLNDFLGVAGIEKPASLTESAIRASLLSLFKSSDTSRLDRICSNGSYDYREVQPTSKVASVARDLTKQYSVCKTDAILDRVMQHGITNLPLTKAASSIEADTIADEYAAYVVSFAHAIEKDSVFSDPEFARNLTAFRIIV